MMRIYHGLHFFLRQYGMGVHWRQVKVEVLWPIVDDSGFNVLPGLGVYAFLVLAVLCVQVPDQLSSVNLLVLDSF